jgi:hypothetical protein
MLRIMTTLLTKKDGRENRPSSSQAINTLLLVVTASVDRGDRQFFPSQSR